MGSMPDLSPLAVERDENHLTFILRPNQSILMQLPPDYEDVLNERLAEMLSEDVPLTAVIDLQGVAALSSRQLGSLIALGKVLRPRFGSVRMTGISASVRRVLELTQTGQFFNLAQA